MEIQSLAKINDLFWRDSLAISESPACLRTSSTTEQQLGARIPGQAARSRYLRRPICLAMYAIRSSVLAPRMLRRPANSLTQRRFALMEGSGVAALGPERLHPVRVSRTSDAVPDRFVLTVEQYMLRPRRRLHRLPCAPPRSLAEFRRKCRERLRLSLVRQRGRQRSCQRPRARRGVSCSHACSFRVHLSRRPRPDRQRPGSSNALRRRQVPSRLLGNLKTPMQFHGRNALEARRHQGDSPSIPALTPIFPVLRLNIGRSSRQR